jgi:hypothetical protein
MFPNLDFGFENKPYGNPVGYYVYVPILDMPSANVPTVKVPKFDKASTCRPDTL